MKFKQADNSFLIAAILCFLFGFVVLLIMLQFYNISVINNYLILLGLTCIIIVPAILYVAVSGLDVFEPLYIIALTYLQVFVIAPWVWLVQGRSSWMGYPVMDGLPGASLFFAAGYIAFLLGYCLRLRNNSREFAGTFDVEEHYRQIVVKMSVALLFVAFACSVLAAYTMGRSLLFTLTLGRVKSDVVLNFFNAGSTQMLFLQMFINMLIPAFMLLYVFQKKYRWLLVPAFAIIALINLSSGFRYRILVLAFAPLLFNFLKSGKRPKLLSIIALISAAFVIVTVVGAWRTNIRSGSELISLNWNVLLKAYMPNVEVFFSYYRIIDVIPQIYPYSFGRGYLYAITIMIPRALWPGKPEPAMQDILRLAFGEQGILSGVAYPNVSEFYIEFGVFGIIAGMYLFGCLARWTISLYRKPRGGLISLICYSMLFPYYLQIVCRGYFPQIFLESLFTFGPVIAVGFLAERMARNVKALEI